MEGCFSFEMDTTNLDRARLVHALAEFCVQRVEALVCSPKAPSAPTCMHACSTLVAPTSRLARLAGASSRRLLSPRPAMKFGADNWSDSGSDCDDPVDMLETRSPTPSEKQQLLAASPLTELTPATQQVLGTVAASVAEAEAETTEAEEEAVRTATAPSVQRSPSLAPTDVVGSPVLSLTSSEPGDDESGDALGGGTTSDDDSGAAIGGGTKRRTSRIVESDEDGDDEPAGAATTFAPRRPGMRGEATRDIARAKRQAEHSTGRSEARPRQQSAVFDDMS